MKLNGKVFVVTGGGSGLGRQLTLQLVSAGAKVAAIDLNEQSVKETAQMAGTDKVLPLVANITDREWVCQLPHEVQARFGRIDGVINNAGIIQPFVNVADADDALVDRIFNINLIGGINVTRAFLPFMHHGQKGDESIIVNVSSLGGFLPVAGQTFYGASKAAVKQFSDDLREELRAMVNVLTVAPGAMATLIRVNSGLGNDITPDNHSNKGTMQPEDAAAQIIKAIRRNKEEIYIGKDSRSMHFFHSLMPHTATKMMNKIIKYQHSHK